MSKKTAIPKSLKKRVWDKYVGENVRNWRCICGLTIDTFTFEAAHIIPESKGGQSCLENLRPLCSMCNKSCGTKNLKEFFKELTYDIKTYYASSQPIYAEGAKPNRYFSTNVNESQTTKRYYIDQNAKISNEVPSDRWILQAKAKEYGIKATQSTDVLKKNGR